MKYAGIEKFGFAPNEIVIEVNEEGELASFSVLTLECTVIVRCEPLPLFISIESQAFAETDGLSASP